MKNLFILVFFLTFDLSFGQIINLELNGVPLRETAYSGVEGSPYLFDDWSVAKIATTNGALKENVSLKFNIHKNELEAISEAGNSILLDKEFLSYFILQRPEGQLIKDGNLKELVFEKDYGFVNGIDDNEFVNVLIDGEYYTLIRRYFTDLITPPKNSYAPSPGRMFIAEETFYLIDENQNIRMVRNRNNNIINSLDRDDKVLGKEIIKQGNLNLNREDHLIGFFDRLNREKNQKDP